MWAATNPMITPKHNNATALFDAPNCAMTYRNARRETKATLSVGPGELSAVPICAEKPGTRYAPGAVLLRWPFGMPLFRRFPRLPWPLVANAVHSEFAFFVSLNEILRYWSRNARSRRICVLHIATPTRRSAKRWLWFAIACVCFAAVSLNSASESLLACSLPTAPLGVK
jgi:hypothetical protein